MGRLLLLLLIVVAVVLVWKAFGPGSSQRAAGRLEEPGPAPIKGPDDDEEFLWKLEKEQFKKRREAQRKADEERERQRRQRREHGEHGDGHPHTPEH